jgi:hypothetical protein
VARDADIEGNHFLYLIRQDFSYETSAWERMRRWERLGAAFCDSSVSVYLGGGFLVSECAAAVLDH